jgi:hypothetical protein
VGNVVTVAMVLVAVMLALALTHPRGQKLPAAVVCLPVWIGAGFLAPITLGLPFGIVVHAFVGGSPAPADDGLHGWVYVVVYAGFVVQAVALCGSVHTQCWDRSSHRNGTSRAAPAKRLALERSGRDAAYPGVGARW